MADAYVSITDAPDKPPTLMVMVTNAGGGKHTEEVSVATARLLAVDLQIALAAIDRRGVQPCLRVSCRPARCRNAPVVAD